MRVTEQIYFPADQNESITNQMEEINTIPQIRSGHDTKHNLSVENRIYITRDSLILLLKSSVLLMHSSFLESHMYHLLEGDDDIKSSHT